MADEVAFSREVPFTDPREIWADGQKWKDFFVLLEKAKHEGASTLVVDRPESLGDTWREVMLNLSAIGSAGLTLKIQGALGVVKAELDCSSGVERDLGERAVFEKKDPLLSNIGRERQRKFGPFIMRPGKEPAVLIHSSGPDEVYCQAELCLMAEWEDFKPSSKGREIQGSYELTAGTIEWFLHKYADKPTHGVIEEYRKRILERGWSIFHVPRGEADSLVKVTKELKNQIKNAPPDAALLHPNLLERSKEALKNLQGR